MRIITDLEQAAALTEWMEPVLQYREPPWSVASLFPQDYPAYTKLFHAMFEDPVHSGSEATWEEEDGAAEQLAWQESFGLTLPGELVRTGSEDFDIAGARRIWWQDIVDQQLLDARANWRTLGQSFAEVSWPRRIIGPDEGRLDPLSLAALVRCVIDSGAEQSCVMFLEYWVALTNGFEDQCAGELGFVALGETHEARRFDEATGRTPQWWWAVDSSWMVYTDVDSCATWVAGPEELIARIAVEPQLEQRRSESSAIAFPDRRSAPSRPESSSRRPWEASGLGGFFRGFAWWVGSLVVGGGVIAFASDSIVAVPIGLSMFLYGLYRLSRGLYSRAP